MNGFEMRQNAKIKQYLNRNKLKTHSPLPIDALLQKSQYSLVVMTPAEFWDFVLNYYKRKGQTEEQTALIMLDLLISQGLATVDAKQAWQDNKDRIKGLGGLLPSFFDAKKLKALAAEMKRGGSAISSYRIQNYAGGSYIILKGNPRLRHQLTGTRYLANNPKVVSMGLGKLGANNALRGGGIVTVVFSALFHGMEQLMNNELTWHHFVGGLAADVVIAAAATGISYIFVSAVAATASIAVGPLIAVVIIGAGVSYLLSEAYYESLRETFIEVIKNIDQHLITINYTGKVLVNYGSYTINQNIKKSMEHMNNNIIRMTKNGEQHLHQASKDPASFLYKLFSIPDTRKF